MGVFDLMKFKEFELLNRFITTNKSNSNNLILPNSNYLANWGAGNGVDIPSLITGAGGTPIVNAGKIATWVDSVTGYAPTQGTDALRLTWTKNDATFNNRSSALGDGTQYLVQSVAANNVPYARNSLTAKTIYIVFASTATSQISAYGESNSGSGTPYARAGINQTLAGRASNEVRSSDSTFVNMVGSSGFNDGAAHLLTVAYDAAATPKWTIHKDGAAAFGNSATDYSAKTFNMDRIILFAGMQTVTPNTIFNGKIARIIIDGAGRNPAIETAIMDYYNI